MWARSVRVFWNANPRCGTITRRLYSVNAEELLAKFAAANGSVSTEQKRQIQMNKYSEKLLAKAKEYVSQVI